MDVLEPEGFFVKHWRKLHGYEHCRCMC